MFSKKIIKLATYSTIGFTLITGITGCQNLSKDEKYNKMSPTEIYKQGVKNIEKKNYSYAVEDFEALEARHPFGNYAEKAQLGAIYANFKAEEYETALPAVDRFLRMYPRHPHIDYVYYMKGLIHFNETLGFLSKYLPMERAERDPVAPQKSLDTFQHLINTFPNSPYVADAKHRMVYLRNLLAEHYIVGARFYLGKSAYLAAANRANLVIEEFDQSPHMEEALYIMAKAYQKLELDELANDAIRVLTLNYPSSKYFQNLV